MACSCRGGSRAGGTTSTGGTIKGFELTYPDGTKADGLFDNLPDAKVARRKAGGGTIRVIT